MKYAKLWNAYVYIDIAHECVTRCVTGDREYLLNHTDDKRKNVPDEFVADKYLLYGMYSCVHLCDD